MTFGFHLLLCFALILLQTTIFPVVPLLRFFYDPIIPFVIYLALNRPIREGLPAAFILGFVQDGLSGAPLGLFLTSYLWLYAGMRWATYLIQVESRMQAALLAVVPAGVLFQNLVFWTDILGLLPDPPRLTGPAVKAMAVQVLWAATTGPFVLIGIGRLQRLWSALPAPWGAGRRDRETEMPAGWAER